MYNIILTDDSGRVIQTLYSTTNAALAHRAASLGQTALRRADRRCTRSRFFPPDVVLSGPDTGLKGWVSDSLPLTPQDLFVGEPPSAPPAALASAPPLRRSVKPGDLPASLLLSPGVVATLHRAAAGRPMPKAADAPVPRRVIPLPPGTVGFDVRGRPLDAKGQWLGPPPREPWPATIDDPPHPGEAYAPLPSPAAGPV